MTRGQKNKKYDMVFVGTGIICVLEAVYQSLSGKSVLMIDQKSKIGGAWASLSIFGVHNVENAVHYFLPDSNAFEFLRNILNLEIIPSTTKYRVFPLFLGFHLKLCYDNKFGRFLARIKEGSGVPKKIFLKNLPSIIQDAFIKTRQPSVYVKGGSPEMLQKINALLCSSCVKVKLSTKIRLIIINNKTKTVKILAGAEKFLSKKIIFTNSSQIPRLTSPCNELHIQQKKHLRPSLHLLIQDKSLPVMHECVMSADSLIKYVHDITRYAQEADRLLGKKKILVVALQHHVQKRNKVISLVLKKLKQVGMIGKSATLENQYWQNIYLPGLNDSDLEKIKTEFGSQVDFLRTENLTKGIGYYAKKWSKKISFKNIKKVP